MRNGATTATTGKSVDRLVTMGMARAAAIAIVLLSLLCVQDAQGLFGMGKGKASKAERDKAGEAPKAAPPPARGPAGGGGSQKLSSKGPGGAPWEDENGELPAIWGVQDGDGVWSFPEGTVLPKDPTSMARIIAIGNGAGEKFQCLLPARTKPLNPEWLDIPQVPMVEDVDTEVANAALSVLDGKCFYRTVGWWTYELCPMSHVKQMHIDPNSNKVVEEVLIGSYSAAAPYELHHNPDRLDHTDQLANVGPAYTTGLTTVYGGGDEAQPGGFFYTCEWVRQKIAMVLPIRRWAAANLKFTRPRQAAVTFKCLRIEVEEKRKWLEDANIYLGKDKTPFDMTVAEPSQGLYQIELRHEALCADPLLYAETVAELSPYGDPNEDIMCQSEKDGKLYKLGDVPRGDGYYHEWKTGFSPMDIGEEGYGT